MTTTYVEDAAAHARHQPVLHALSDLLMAAFNVETDAARRAALEARLLRVAGTMRESLRDITQDAALAEMIAAGLAPEGTEAYGVFVKGLRIGAILARNVHHARNKAKKEHALDVVEYRRVGDEHQLHGARLAPHDDQQASADIARIMRLDADQPEPVAVKAQAAPHVFGLDKDGPDKRWPVRATCSCGWRGLWHATEAKTRVSATNHAHAFGVLAPA